MKSIVLRCFLPLLAALLWAPVVQAQSSGVFLDCNCLLKLPGLQTNACQAVVPDLCAVATNCYRSTLVPPSPLSCSQSPTPGTVVGPGTTSITFTITDLATGQSAFCKVNFVVSPLPACAFTLLCASNQTVECGTAWSFNPPTWTNNCVPPPGTPSNGVSVVVINTTTNGSCPQIITQSWQATDDCGNHDQCSQTITIVDTTPPVLNCSCITNSSVGPVQMTVTACSALIPDLCFPARSCASDNCGPLNCLQSPAPGTSVLPGVYPITVTVYDCASNTASCVVNFTVIQPAGGCAFSLLCSSNQTVECGNAWSFIPPAWTNNCSPPPGTPSNGVSVVVISLITNGSCPQVITKTWKATDDCGNTAQCSQTVTVVDTTPPQLNCACLTNNPVFPISLTVYACTSSIPDLCLAARVCASDSCGITGCAQSPAAGTIVGPGVYPLTVTVYDCASNTASCTLNFTVISSGQTNVWNTGMGGISGNIPLPAGTPDTNFLLVAVPTGGCPGPSQVIQPGFIPGAWVANGPDSQWISASSTASCVGGVYHYRLCFNLPCDNVSIVGQWSCDDGGAIVVNGQPASQTIPSPQYPNLPLYQWFPVNLTNGFVCGNNCLDFYVTNANIGSNPTGLRAELTNIVSACSCTCTNCLIMLACPTNLVATTCSNTAVVVYPPATASSTCGTVPTITYSPPSGSPFPIGTTVVTVTATDAQGHSSSCTFTVTVAQSPNCCTIIPVLHLFSGATNNIPGLLPGGAFDLQFSTSPPLFSTPNPYVPSVINGWWIPNGPSSKWIGPSPNYVYSPPGVYLYTSRFFLCSTNQASITGRWAGDDSGQILLNGLPTGNLLPNGWAFTNWSPVSITSGFVPGWNQLTFAITNGGYSPTGLRTEIIGSACCKQCVSISCPTNVLTSTCGHGAIVNYLPPVASSACGNIVSITSSPPSGSAFPVGTTVVTCTAVDSQGNAATCTFTVTVQLIGKPVSIKCPPDQVLYTCGTTAVAYYHPSASGNVGPIVCTPPSGATFPVGTNFVTCTVTNACGNVASCSFRIIVISYLSGPPALTYLAGLPDNFVLPTEPASPSACLLTAENNYPLWKPFDATPVNTLFGYRFNGLPNNIIQGQLVTRLRPENDGVGVGVGSDNDGWFVGLTNCTFPGGWAWLASIKTLPGAGGSWMPGHPAVTFTNNLTPAVIAHINSALHLDVMVHDDTTVDYMQLRLWTCPPPINPNGGVPHWTTVSANPSLLTLTPQPELPGFGPIGRGPSLAVDPPGGDLGALNSVQIGIGGGQAFGFTTVLDMSAPDGAQIVVSTPTDGGPNTPVFTLVKGCKPRCGWDIIKSRITDDTSSERSSAVNTNGVLLDSFVVAEAQIDTDSLLHLEPEPGVDQFPVSFLLDSVTGELTITFPGSTARRLCNGLPCPRGWDGTIKSFTEEALRKGWDGVIRCPCFDDSASRVVITPLGGPALPPRPVLVVSSTGLSELVLAGEHLYTMGREVTGADDSPLIVQGTTQGDGVSFAALQDYSGVLLDLGHAASFDVGIHHFENGDIPTQEQLFRIGGPKCLLCLTNRLPPPPIELRLTQSPDGVGAAADFSGIGATALQIQLYSNGVYIAYGDLPGPAMSPEEPLLFDHWPERLALMGTNGVVRLTSTTWFNIQGFLSDEVRFVPNLPPEAPPFTYASELECRTPAGVESVLYDLQRTSACAPATLNAVGTSAGTVFTWSADGYRLLGAETLAGPWVELGVASPVVLTPNAPQRFFRLVCE
jgi:hypothetical protein